MTEHLEFKWIAEQLKIELCREWAQDDEEESEGPKQ